MGQRLRGLQRRPLIKSIYKWLSQTNHQDPLARDTISNVQLWQKTGQLAADEEIRKRRWGWIGHILRRPPTNITRQALRWNPQGKRKRGRPKNTWRRDLEAESTKMGYTWSQVEKMAEDRGLWRSLVGGP